MIIIELLRKLTKSLDEKGINYMLTGSIALNHYTLPRMTLDIDMVVELREKNLADFLLILGSNYYFNKETIKLEIARCGMFNVIDYETGFKIDFIIRKDSEYKKLEFSRRIRSINSDFDVWIVSPEDLVIAKIEWIQQLQSDKQIQDIQNLLFIPGIDKDYIKNWCKRLNFKTFNLI